jgi:starch phosphorylase
MEQRARHGHPPADLRRVDTYFQAGALTIGFARRFATYKRADLIFSDPHALRRLLSDPERPVQLVFAGKAHPADRPGQELIKHIFQLSQSEELRGRVFFLEGYDMRMARMLLQGCSVWLNTPRRPQEASGTSGQKAAMNGLLNVSVLDGWWPECWSGDNGWAIGDHDHHDDPQQQDREDVQSLYRVLEDEVVPAFFERPGAPPGTAWLSRMKRSIASVACAYSSHRMVMDYAQRAYLPRVRQPLPIS